MLRQAYGGSIASSGSVARVGFIECFVLVQQKAHRPPAGEAVRRDHRQRALEAALRKRVTVWTGQSRRIRHGQGDCKLCCKIKAAVVTTRREDVEDRSARGIWDAPTREATESLLFQCFWAGMPTEN